jgi:tetratricopeptide (TPR) repeat protein
MNVNSSAAVLMVLLWTSSIASTADTPAAPITRIEPPEGSLAAECPVVDLRSRPVRKTPFVATLKDYPEIPTELKQAIELLQKKRLDDAIHKLHGNRDWGRNLPTGYILLYLAFDGANQPAAARSCLEKAAVEYPADPEPWLFLGEIAIDENRLAEAKNDFDHAMQLLANYKNAERKPHLEQRLSRGIAEVAKVLKSRVSVRH